MAENGKKGWPEGYDGRFGNRFDQEVDTGFVVKVIIATAIVTGAAIAITLGLQPLLAPDTADATAFELLPIEGPRLQADPEEDLEAMQREEAARLGARVGNVPAPEGSGWGWVDESAGIVHMPIDVAMRLYLEARPGGEGPAAGDAADDAASEEEAVAAPAAVAAPEEAER